MITFKRFLNSLSSSLAREPLHEARSVEAALSELEAAAFRPSLGDVGKEVRMPRLGFQIVHAPSGDDKHKFTHAYFGNSPPLGEEFYGELPMKTIQAEATLAKAQMFVKKFNRVEDVPAIYTAKDGNGELIIVDGNHRAAALKVLGLQHRVKLVEVQ